MRIQFSLVLCLLFIDVMSTSGQEIVSAPRFADRTPILLPPDAQVGQVANPSHIELLPPARTVASELELHKSIGSPSLSEPVIQLPSGFEAMEHSDRLRIWNLPYGVWVATSDRDPAQPHCHLDPTGMSYLAYPSLGQTSDVTVYFARSSFDLNDPAHRFEKNVRLVANQTVNFDFAREGGNIGYGKNGSITPLVDLPKPAAEPVSYLPVAVSVKTHWQADATIDELNGDIISSLVNCHDLSPTIYKQRIALGQSLETKDDDLKEVRLCEIAIKDRDESCLRTEWVLRGKVQVDAGKSSFVAREGAGKLALKVRIVHLSSLEDPKRKVFVLAEEPVELTKKLSDKNVLDSSDQLLHDYLKRLEKDTEGTIRLTDVQLILNGTELKSACTDDVSEIQIHIKRTGS